MLKGWYQFKVMLRYFFLLSFHLTTSAAPDKVVPLETRPDPPETKAGGAGKPGLQ